MATQHVVETIEDNRYSDLIMYEKHVGGGIPFSRDWATVNNAAGGTYEMGTLVFRAKGADATVAWDIVDAAGDINVANEYGILVGDDIQIKNDIVLAAGVAKKCIVITREALFKDAYVRAIYTAAPYSLSTANVNSLVRLLATQGILSIDQMTKITA